MKYVTKTIDFSPMLCNEQEAIAACIYDMKGKGYKLATETFIGISWVLLVFETAQRIYGKTEKSLRKHLVTWSVLLGAVFISWEEKVPYS